MVGYLLVYEPIGNEGIADVKSFATHLIYLHQTDSSALSTYRKSADELLPILPMMSDGLHVTWYSMTVG